MTRLAIAAIVLIGSTFASGLTFSAPPEWKTVVTSSSMRVAQWTLPRAAGDTQDGELVVYYFGGQGGSLDANIERWAGQLHNNPGFRMRAGYVETATGPYFIKLVGPSKTISAHDQQFETFLSSVKFAK